MSNNVKWSVMRYFCSRMLTPLRSVFIALLPFQPELQSMAASFHGSANIRCVSSPSGGLSSRRAYLSVAALFGFHGRSNIYYVISFDSSSTVLGYLRSSPVSEVSENTRTPAQKSPPPAGACHRPPPIRFPSFVMRVQMRFSIPVQQFLIHGRIANIILVKKNKTSLQDVNAPPPKWKKKSNKKTKTRITRVFVALFCCKNWLMKNMNGVVTRYQGLSQSFRSPR